jgi:hypothetical protein
MQYATAYAPTVGTSNSSQYCVKAHEAAILDSECCVPHRARPLGSHHLAAVGPFGGGPSRRPDAVVSLAPTLKSRISHASKRNYRATTAHPIARVDETALIHQ